MHRIQRKQKRRRKKKAPRLVDIPSEIEREILSRLPMEAMLRFKFVCKMWYGIATELLSINRIILARKPSYLSEPSVFLVDERRDNRICREYSLRFPPSFYEHGTVVGSCNGILCIAPDIYDGSLAKAVYLYNPITGEGVESPVPPACKMDENMFLYGFGFDSVSNKYKVVSVYRQYYWYTDYIEGNLTEDDLATRGLIITLGEDESWREIILPYNVKFGERAQTLFHDGLFHWLIEKEDARRTGSEIILALDINSEKFYSFRFPPSIKLPDPSDSQLINFADSLALAVCDASLNLLRIWQIEGSKTSTRWVKQYTINLSPTCGDYLYDLLGVSDGGILIYVATEKIVYRYNSAGYMVAGEEVPKRHVTQYDLRKKCVSVLEMVGAPENFSAHFFVPTLVSPMSLCCRNQRNG